MASADTVRSLVEQDEGMADSMAAVYKAADGGDEEVEWADVSDDISSGHWGRLIETGVLIDGDTGFRFQDAEAVHDALEEVDAGLVSYEPSSSDIELPEESSWTTYDKLAAAVSVGMIAGYTLESVRSVIGGAIDLALGPLNAIVPFHITILVIALLTGLVSSLVQGNMMDMDKMSKYQARMKDIQQRRKAAKERDDEEALERIQQEQMEAMGDQLGMFKEQFRPTVWIMLFTIPMFLWIYWQVWDGQLQSNVQLVLPLAGEVAWDDGIVGPIQVWIIWYFLCSMCFTNIIRKSLNIKSPTSASSD